MSDNLNLRERVHGVLREIDARITYKPYPGIPSHRVAVCDCGKWESRPHDRIGLRDHEEMTREVWLHVSTAHMTEEHVKGMAKS